MKKIIKLFFVLIVMVSGLVSRAQAQDAITLSDCKLKALAHNQNIKAKEAAYKSGEASVELSKRAALPNIDFSGSYTYQSDPMQMVIPGYELPTTEGTPSGVYSPGRITNLSYSNVYNANLGLSLPIYMGGKLAESKKIAQHALEIAQSDVALSKTDVILSIEQQYWALVSLLEQKKVVEKSILFLADVVEDMNNRYTFGIVTKNEVLKAQVELNDAKLLLINIDNNISLAKMAMNQSIGEDINNPLSIADTSIEITINPQLIEYDVDNLLKRKEIRILNKQMEINQAEEKIVRSDYLPELVSFANYSFQNPDHLAQDEGELIWTAGVSMSIPVFHWGERRYKITQAKMSQESTAQNLDQTKELITLEMQQAIFRVRESLKKLEFTIEAMKQAEENLDLESDRLQEEVATTTDLLNAQTQWQKLHADFIAAKAEVKINEAQYYKAIGELNAE